MEKCATKRVLKLLNDRIFEKALSVDVACYENPEFYDKYQRATMVTTNSFFDLICFDFSAFVADVVALVCVLINVMATGCLPGVQLVNGWLSEIVLKCTQIDETNRYKNIDDLILDLERRSKLQRLLRTVPGFRKGIWWHQLIAVLSDIALLFFLIVAMSTAHSLLDALCTFGFFFFGYAVPVPILTNYLDWTHRIARLQNKTKSQRIWIQISLSALAQVLSVLCIIASPAT